MIDLCEYRLSDRDALRELVRARTRWKIVTRHRDDRAGIRLIHRLCREGVRPCLLSLPLVRPDLRVLGWLFPGYTGPDGDKIWILEKEIFSERRMVQLLASLGSRFSFRIVAHHFVFSMSREEKPILAA